MQVRWYGQSTFRLSDGGTTVFIDPFGSMEAAAQRGMRFDYPPIRDARADLLLVTHEHLDHNAVEVVGGSPRLIRSTAGTFETPLGQVVAIASEHDTAAGTQRGPNTIFAFEFGGLRCCHFGDLGQCDLRPEQAAAIGRPDLLFLPVGGGPTIDGRLAAAIAVRLNARWVVPMHYRTAAVNFLEPAEGFLERMGERSMQRLAAAEFDTAELRVADGPLAVVPAIPSPD